MKIAAGLVSIMLSGCSFLAYRSPVVVPPPGGGDPRTAVGASVRCNSSAWPVAADLVGASASAYLGVVAFGTLLFLSAFSDSDERDDLSGEFVAAFVPAALYVSSGIYGGVHLSRCHKAHLASARAKLRGEPLRLEGVKVELPARGGAPVQPPAQLSPLPAGPPSTTAPLPNP